MERDQALELSVVARTLKDVHLAQRGQFDATAEALAAMQQHFSDLAEGMMKVAAE